MYRQAVITFIDILGFKHLISSGTFEDVSEKLKTVRRLSNVDDHADGESFEPKVIQFSDSIIRIRPLDSKTNKQSRYGLMFFEMLDLVHMQGELINHGICLRGGVSIGDVHVDDHMLFGPGFVRAYELESVYANFPRIVVDPALIQQLQKDKRLASMHNKLADEFAYIRKNIRRESDGIYFIDYLRSFRVKLMSRMISLRFFEITRNSSSKISAELLNLIQFLPSTFGWPAITTLSFASSRRNSMNEKNWRSHPKRFPCFSPSRSNPSFKRTPSGAA